MNNKLENMLRQPKGIPDELMLGLGAIAFTPIQSFIDNWEEVSGLRYYLDPIHFSNSMIG